MSNLTRLATNLYDCRQYAFSPQDTSQHNPAPLAKTQAAPRFFQRTGHAENSNPSSDMLASSSTSTWLKREDSVQRQTLVTGNIRQGLQNNSSGANQQPSGAKFKPSLPGNAPHTRSATGRRQVMGPPPTPRRTGSRIPPPAPGFGPAQAKQQPTQGMSTPAVNRRFVPPSSSGNPAQGRSQHTSQGNQAGRSMPGMGGSGQRMPFVPGGAK